MIEKYPSKILSTPSTDCTLEEGKDIVRALRVEASKLRWGKVVGLAAPQIGINKRVFLALEGMYVNARITEYHGSEVLRHEGCYSLQKDKFDYPVMRYEGVTLEWVDFITGEKRTRKMTGFLAQVVQHEYDHLEGRLCSGQ